MQGRTLLRTVLVLWMARLTLQGGTGFGLGPQAANAYPPNFKGQGYGAAQPSGPGGKPNGSDKMLLKGYGAASAALRNGAKPNGYGPPPNGNINGARAPPAAVKGNGGYGAALGASNGQAAKPNGGFGSKPSQPGYGVGQPAYGGIGIGMVPQQAAKHRGGFGNGNGQGYKGQSFGGSRQGPGAYAQAGAGLGGGYSNGAKAAKPGFGAGSALQSGQGAKTKGYGAGAGSPNSQGAKPAGYGGYPNGGNFKGPKAGYGGVSPSYGARPNGYGAYPNGGAKGPKPGYGAYPSGGTKGPKPGYGAVAGAGANNGQGAKPNGYGTYPSGGAKGPKPGYGAIAGAGAINGQGAKPNGYGTYPSGGAKGPKPGYGAAAGAGALGGQEAKPNGYNPNLKGYKDASLGPEAPRVPAVPSYTKGVVPPAEPEPTRGVPRAPEPTIGVLSLLAGGKGQKPLVHPQAPLIPQGKGPKPVAPQLSQVLSQSKGPKPSLPVSVLPQAQATITPEHVAGVLQGSALRPAQAAPLLPYIPQGKAPKPIAQVPQVPASPQQAVSQVEAQRPFYPAPVPQPSQTKGLQHVGAESLGPQSAPEPTRFPSQLKGPKATNAELAGLGQPNGQGAKPAKPDCGPGGVSGQWTKLPSPGIGPGAWYPNNGGAKASKSGLGGYGAKPNQPGYNNGQGILPATGYGYGNGPASFGEAVKGNPGNGYLPAAGGTGQLPYNGAPIVPAGMDGTGQIQPQTAELGHEAKSAGAYGTGQIQPQTAELGPEAKSAGAYGGPYGAQPMGVGSKAKSQMKYGIGGLPFAGSPMGYGSDPYGKYGNPYAAQPYGGSYGAPYNPKPLGLGSDPRSASKYGYGGSPYGGQPLGYGAKDKSSKSGSVLGLGGLPYGTQPLTVGPDAGKSGKYGQPAAAYAPESVSYGGDGKFAGKYGKPALPFNSGIAGPVTDGQSVEQPALPYEALPGPEIDGMKSVDQFGEGEIPPQPDAALIQGSTGTGSYLGGGLQPEAVSFSAPVTAGPPPVSAGSTPLPLDTAVLPEAGPSALAPLQAEPHSAQLPSLTLQPATPQQIHIQQQLKVHLHTQGKSWTGGTEGKYGLKGFLGNGYQG
ncbi:calymmin isoform X11 [Astyanax mexicanus]|uniref:calymmin isoform X11 n=1 Tax=Astyanax mexicanus TaxID=7994 RepID=UPI0020CB0E69|nr:calymmin isoform X11 [Astyanax mexicanus]